MQIHVYALDCAGQTHSCCVHLPRCLRPSLRLQGSSHKAFQALGLPLGRLPHSLLLPLLQILVLFLGPLLMALLDWGRAAADEPAGEPSPAEPSDPDHGSVVLVVAYKTLSPCGHRGCTR